MDLPEREQCHLEKKCSHLLSGDAEKDDRLALGNDVDMGPGKSEKSDKNNIAARWGCILFVPFPFGLILARVFFWEPPDRRASVEIARLTMVNDRSTIIRVTIGICGCLFCLWAVWPAWPILRFLAPFPLLVTYSSWGGSILAFLLSLFGLKNEKYFSLTAQILLAIFWIGLLISTTLYPDSFFMSQLNSLFIAEGLFLAERLFLFQSGMFVVFVCLFPSAYHGKIFFASAILFYVLFWLWFSF